MKLKRALALAGAAMVLCGLLASSASAESIPSDLPLPMHLNTCAISHDEERAIEGPDKTPQEVEEAWKAAEAAKCVSMTVTDQASWDQYEVFWNCIGEDWSTKADLDRCLAIATNGNPTGQARKQHQRKHHRHHHRRHAHS
jgi:hypothetical protein